MEAHITPCPHLEHVSHDEVGVLRHPHWPGGPAEDAADHALAVEVDPHGVTAVDAAKREKKMKTGGAVRETVAEKKVGVGRFFSPSPLTT